MIGFHSSATGGVLLLEFMVNGARKSVALPSILAGQWRGQRTRRRRWKAQA